MASARWCLCLLAAVVLANGCRTAQQIRDPEYLRVSHSMQRASRSLDPSAQAVAVPNGVMEGAHSVDQYLRFALRQNPEIHAARKRTEALAHRVPVAASLPDPSLGLTVLPAPIQTAAGQQELTLSASQKLPRRSKLAARAAMVESQTNAARAELAAVELATIAQVKRAFYELQFVQRAIRVTKTDRQLLVEIRTIANSRYRTGQTSQQDVLRADLEISNVESELIRLDQRLQSAQARLARLLHVAPQTRLRALDQSPSNQLPRNLDSLQRRAVAARPELHARLAGLKADRRAVELARLDYLPDVTLGATWIDVSTAGISPVSNGRDAFLITAAVNLPVYRKRLDSAVRSAEAQAVATARDYDALRDKTLQQVLDLFVQARSQQDLLTLFREDILPKSNQTLEVSLRAYNTGEVDFLQLVDNWRQLLRYEMNHLRLKASLQQNLAELERVVGGFGGSPFYIDDRSVPDHVRSPESGTPGEPPIETLPAQP